MPFVSHNGLVARATEWLVLVARGVDEKSLVVPEAGHLALRPEYESNLWGYRDGGARGRARLAALRRRGVRRRARRRARSTTAETRDMQAALRSPRTRSAAADT